MEKQERIAYSVLFHAVSVKSLDMRALLQRVTEGRVVVAGQEVGRSGPGLCIFLAIGKGDTEDDVRSMVDKVKGLRIFEDGEGKMNRSLTDIGGEVLLVSEFTLYGDCKKGRRPSFGDAASPEEAESLYRSFEQELRPSGVKVATGIFQAKMAVSVTNDGPVTFILDSH